jgi:adenylate kinase
VHFLFVYYSISIYGLFIWRTADNRRDCNERIPQENKKWRLYMKIIMLGAPGAGKGTQAKMIAEKYGVPHISTGDIFRANIKNGTELGAKAKEYMDKGLLVPDELVVDLVIDRFKAADCAKGYILDGFPRTIPQAEALDKALSAIGDSVDYAINVEVPDENIVLVTRPESSGTRATFQKYALDGNEEASNTSMETDDSGVLLTNVKSTNGAIGYVALSYLTGDAGVETVAIDDVEPTLENTYSGKYPVWTFEHMYTKGEPNEVTKAFLDYITGDEYGAQMEKLGYGVASKMTVTEH